MHNVEHKFEEAVRLAAVLPANEHYLTEPVAARWLQLYPSMLVQLRKAGRGPQNCRVGRRVLYRRSDLLSWANRLIKQAA